MFGNVKYSLKNLFQRKIHSEFGKYLRFNNKHTTNENLRDVVTKAVINGKFVALSITICKRRQIKLRECRKMCGKQIYYKENKVPKAG